MELLPWEHPLFFCLFVLIKALKTKVREAEAGAVPCRGGREGRGR